MKIIIETEEEYKTVCENIIDKYSHDYCNPFRDAFDWRLFDWFIEPVYTWEKVHYYREVQWMDRTRFGIGDTVTFK